MIIAFNGTINQKIMDMINFLFGYAGHICSHVSVINGYGTFGGIDIMDETNHGLLEIMCEWMDDVTGYLTADEVISILNEKLSGGRQQ